MRALALLGLAVAITILQPFVGMLIVVYLAGRIFYTAAINPDRRPGKLQKGDGSSELS